jgi:crossover junction endodeoxyribonuclease RusA
MRCLLPAVVCRIHGPRKAEGAMIFDLPYPPSVNHYWLARGKKRFISGAGRKFRRDAFYLIKAAQARLIEGDCHVRVELYMPDKRKRDIDNILKPILDILQYSGVIRDDSQVCALSVARIGHEKGGRARVQVSGDALRIVERALG